MFKGFEDTVPLSTKYGGGKTILHRDTRRSPTAFGSGFAAERRRTGDRPPVLTTRSPVHNCRVRRFSILASRLLFRRTRQASAGCRLLGSCFARRCVCCAPPLSVGAHCGLH